MSLLRSAHVIRADAYLPAYSTDATPSYDVTYTAAVVFTEDFEGEVSASSWASADGGTVSRDNTQHDTGSYSLKLVSPTGAAVTARLAVSGLASGVRYRVVSRAKAVTGTPDVGVGLSGGVAGITGETVPAGNTWAYGGSYDGRPTSGTLYVYVRLAAGAAGQAVYFDNITITRLAQTVTVPGTPSVVVPEGDPSPLSVVAAQVGLDDSWTPYAQTTLVCSAPDSAALPLIDPRDQRRVKLALEQSFGVAGQNFNAFGPRPAVTRLMDLVLAGREVNHDTGEVTLTLASDEVLLRAYGLVATTPYVPVGNNVVRAVMAALDRIKAGIPGVRRQEVVNPQLGTNATDWNVGYGPGGAGTVARVNLALTFAWWYQATFTTAPTAVGAAIFNYSNTAGRRTLVTPGRSYAARIAGHVTWSGALTRCVIYWYDGSGTIISATAGAASAHTVNTMQTRFALGVAPPGAVTARVDFQHQGGTLPSIGSKIAATAANIEASPTIATGYGDGTQAGWAWDGTAHASASMFVPTSQSNAAVAADAMPWQPGQTGWAYVAPLVQAAGLRLWCDELRVWHLESTTARKDGLVRLTTDSNVTSAVDTISQLDNAEFYTGVVLRYQWADAAGVVHTQYDTAGTATKVRYDEISTVYPGPGAAAVILAQAAGRGRVFALEAFSDYLTEPGKALSADLPDTPTQVGYVRSVRWRFPDAEMTVQQRELTETPSSAWVYDAPGISWNSIPVGIDWTEDI